MLTPQWAADIHVDIELAAELVRAQFEHLDVHSVTPYGHGWDNTAFLVNESLVFRFPRRAAFANLIEIETAVLPAIAAALPLAISAPTFVGVPSERYPYVFAGYPLIAGVPAEAHTQFAGAYGHIDEHTWNTARYRAIHHALLELEYGVDENDVSMRDAGLWTLQAVRHMGF